MPDRFSPLQPRAPGVPHPPFPFGFCPIPFRQPDTKPLWHFPIINFGWPCKTSLNLVLPLIRGTFWTPYKPYFGVIYAYSKNLQTIPPEILWLKNFFSILFCTTISCENVDYYESNYCIYLMVKFFSYTLYRTGCAAGLAHPDKMPDEYCASSCAGPCESRYNLIDHL